MKGMQNAFLGVISFGAYVALAIYQSAQSTFGDLTIAKDIGMGGAFIATCIFMFRYFTAQIEKKDAQQSELTKEFIKLVEKAVANDAANLETNKKVIQGLEDLNKKL